MIPKLRTALTLSPGDWRVLGQAWVLLLAVDLGLRALSFRRVQALAGLRAKHVPPVEAAEAVATSRRLQWLVGKASHNHLYPMRCLQRALVLQWLLSRRGIETALRIGVRKEAGELSAHAWLEHAGRPIGEPENVGAHFLPLVLPVADRRSTSVTSRVQRGLTEEPTPEI